MGQQAPSLSHGALRITAALLYKDIFSTPREIATAGKRYRWTMIYWPTDWQTFPVALSTHSTWWLTILQEEANPVQPSPHLLSARYRKKSKWIGLSQVSFEEDKNSS